MQTLAASQLTQLSEQHFPNMLDIRTCQLPVAPNPVWATQPYFFQHNNNSLTNENSTHPHLKPKYIYPNNSIFQNYETSETPESELSENIKKHGSYFKILPELGMTVESVMRMQVNFEVELPSRSIPSTRQIKEGNYLFPFVHSEIIMDVKDLDGNPMDSVQSAFRMAPRIFFCLLMAPMFVLVILFLVKMGKKRWYQPVPSDDSNSK